jgi:hypothetical protein
MSSMRETARTWETQETGEMRRLRCAGGARWFTTREAFDRHAPTEGKPS